MEPKPLKICDTILRDAHQSLLATRMRTDDMLPIAAKLDRVGYWSVEMWGGATFDSAMRFLNENPWDRVRRLKKVMPNTRFQMLLRAQNVVGYRHYPDDVLQAFVIHAKDAGIDVFRIFDALNDIRNMEAAMRFVKDANGHVQASFSYTISPVHTIAQYVEMAHQFKEMGADSVCIKDMAGMIAPYDTYELVGQLVSEVGLPVQFHTHYTSGMAMASALKAVEAGVDVVDTAISSLSGLTAQPPTESLVAILKDTPRDTHLDLNLLAEISGYFSQVRKRYQSFESGLQGVDVRVLQFQIPGGMLSNLTSQLRQQGASERYEEVLAETPRVRRDLGYPPLVTPSSQIVGTQATLNVITGQRYKVIPEEIKNYVRGFYGRPPAPIDPEVKQLVIGDEEPITCRPADLIPPGMETARQELGELAQNEEDVISYALFPQVARPFLARRAKGTDEKTAVIAAIAARVALEADAAEPARVIKTTAKSQNAWKQAWRPSHRWTGLSR